MLVVAAFRPDGDLLGSFWRLLNWFQLQIWKETDQPVDPTSDRDLVGRHDENGNYLVLVTFCIILDTESLLDLQPCLDQKSPEIEPYKFPALTSNDKISRDKKAEEMRHIF